MALHLPGSGHRRPGPAFGFVLFAALAVCAGSTVTAHADSRERVRKIGDVGQYVPLGMGLTLIAAHNDRSGALELALATASSLALTHSLKPIVNRTRPNGGKHSFPSGHATIAFAGAGYVQRRYGWGWGAPAYAVGIFVGYSRVYAKEHFTTDVLAGGAIGLASNLVFTRRYHKVSVTPIAHNGAPGLALSISW